MTGPADGESATAGIESPDEDASVESDSARDDDHLADVEEGAGCTEIWEHLSEQRESGEN
ncbi:hypothetical protein [Salinirubrum litoreum]|uniref:Uncharacterized protein n=1 Tax=Salinirubrum litoreum TaxID=1126234 RepID=A0ABD5REJ2_9EURY|nr:hypothetical protein [Salinirubrum litoreum]